MRLYVGRGTNIGFIQLLGVPFGRLLAQRQFLFECSQFWQQDGGLQRIEAAVHSYPDVMVAPVLALTC